MGDFVNIYGEKCFCTYPLNYSQLDDVLSELQNKIRAGRIDEITNILIDDPNIANRKDRFGNTALHWVGEASQYALPIAMLLICKGANPKEPNNRGETPIDWAKSSDNDELSNYLETILPHHTPWGVWV